MKLKETLYLLSYSIKSLFYDDLMEILDSLKKAKTWSMIMYSILFVGIYYRNMTLITLSLPFVILLYIVRQNKEPEYNRALREWIFRNNDEKGIMEYYEKYKKQCYFSIPKKEPLSLEEYKKDELKKFDARKYTEQDMNDA